MKLFMVLPKLIDRHHIANVCRAESGKRTCRFLAQTSSTTKNPWGWRDDPKPGNQPEDGGWRCLKSDPDWKALIEERQDKMRAEGDYCSGPPDFEAA